MQYYNIPIMPPCEMPNQYMIPAQDIYSFPQNFPIALQLIRDAVSGERSDELFYDYLISVAPSEEDKNIIGSIRDDERQHNRLFRQIYLELTGQMIPPPSQEEEFTRPQSYCAGIQTALFGELGAVERYRIILFALQDRTQINILTRIITDEQKHATKYNFLYSKNKCH